METDIDKLREYLPSLDAENISRLTKYYESLIYFNAKVNLVSSATLPYAAKQHFADSFLGLNVILELQSFKDTVYDFGSGNGFPGLVLGIIRPDVSVCLVERDLRKAEFMKHVIGELKLGNMTVYAGSIESLEKESISHGITRALGSISRVLIQVNSLFVTGATLFHFKSESWPSEVASCPTQLFTRWDIQPAGQYTLPESAISRTIVLTKKK